MLTRAASGSGPSIPGSRIRASVSPAQDWYPESTSTWPCRERSSTWFGRALTQTLEPRVLYVNTPYRAQDTLPLFDTAAKGSCGSAGKDAILARRAAVPSGL